ncbi:MAG TPA: hypothetical protein PLU52_01850 [Opitutaceae bacterium]|nr:hypothetical protein [Opitutaceae bacterium]HND62154.1 hypothetical protein [Opitutaceae bacterium]
MTQPTPSIAPRGAWYRRWRWPGPGRIEWVLNAVAVAIALYWLAGLAMAHVRIVAQPGPQEYNEPAIWHTTWLLHHGRNPYTIEELPGSAYCFGPLYNYVVLALEPLLGIDYPAHRMVVLFFLAGALALVVYTMRKAGAGLGVALLSAVFYYWMSLGNIEITARPDTMGLCFFMLGLFVPWACGYTRWSTIFGLLCAVVAFNCKSYFAVAGCGTLLCHFLVRSRREAIWFGVGFFALVGLTFALSCHYFPYFFIETVIVQRGGAAVNDRDDISLMHTALLVQRGWPYLALMLLGLGGWLWRFWRRRQLATEPAARAEERAYLGLGVTFYLMLVLVLAYMGRNAGAFFTYHLHLLFPLMFMLAARAATHPWVRVAFAAVMIGMVTTWVEVPPVPDSSAAYGRLRQMIGNSQQEILGIASLTDIFDRNGRRVLHDGNTMFMGFAFGDGGIERDPMIAALAKNYERTEGEVLQKVADRTYGIVFTEFDDPYFCSPQQLKEGYEKFEQIEYYTYFGHSPIWAWRPKAPKQPGTGG